MRDSDPISDDEAAGSFAGHRYPPPRLLRCRAAGLTALMWLGALARRVSSGPPKLIAVTIDHGLAAGVGARALAVKRLANAWSVATAPCAGPAQKPDDRHCRRRRGRALSAARRRGARGAAAMSILPRIRSTIRPRRCLFRMARAAGEPAFVPGCG